MYAVSFERTSDVTLNFFNWQPGSFHLDARQVPAEHTIWAKTAEDGDRVDATDAAEAVVAATVSDRHTELSGTKPAVKGTIVLAGSVMAHGVPQLPSVLPAAASPVVVHQSVGWWQVVNLWQQLDGIDPIALIGRVLGFWVTPLETARRALKVAKPRLAVLALLRHRELAPTADMSRAGGGGHDAVVQTAQAAGPLGPVCHNLVWRSARAGRFPIRWKLYLFHDTCCIYPSL